MRANDPSTEDLHTNDFSSGRCTRTGPLALAFNHPFVVLQDAGTASLRQTPLQKMIPCLIDVIIWGVGATSLSSEVEHGRRVGINGSEP